MADADFLPLSYLSQYWFCPRRAGLLLLEQLWRENEYTAGGAVSHRRVHDAGVEKRGELVKLFEFAVQSERMGIRGYCDCIEARSHANGTLLPGLGGRYRLYPIEYKHGVVRDELEYNVQLCAQAMCLEEMLDAAVPRGAVFYTDSHRRVEVVLDEDLRGKVVEGVTALRAMLSALDVPRAQKSAKCRKCSMSELCMPGVHGSAKTYMKAVIRAASDAPKEEAI